MRKFFAPTAMALILVSVIFLFTNFGYERSVHAEEVAEMAQRMEALENEIRLLRKNIQILADLLDDIAKATKANVITQPIVTPPATTASAVPQPALRSPRQIDRPATGNDEKAVIWITKLRLEPFSSREDVMEVFQKLIKQKAGGNFVQSLKKQLTEWLDATPDDRGFDFPMSPKQYAWACHIMFKSKYENPRKNKELYPNG